MATTQDKIRGVRSRLIAQHVVRGAGLVIIAAAAAVSAIVVKNFSIGEPLAAVDLMERRSLVEPAPALVGVTEPLRGGPVVPAVMAVGEPAVKAPAIGGDEGGVYAAAPLPAWLAQDPSVRWFNGRPVRPARKMWMVVTAYSPDERSCGGSADGITATLHSVETNGFRSVAADTRVLPFGSLISVPGYDGGSVVPVLDRGGAIKGNRLDVLFPTDAAARAWGRKRIQVTVWEYADGKPADDPRRVRGGGGK